MDFGITTSPYNSKYFKAKMIEKYDFVSGCA